MIMQSDTTFIGFEYYEIQVPSKFSVIYEDGYTNFGWELTSKATKWYSRKSILHFKRNRRIRNKAELTRLQRQFESVVRDIISLEKSKKKLAKVTAILIAIIGCGFMAGSVFAVTSRQILWTVVLGIIGFVFWILPYVVYKKISELKIIQLEPKIENNYETLYEISEKGSHLL